MGGTDEQYQTVSGGYGTEGTGLRIEDAPADTTPEGTADKEENEQAGNPPVVILSEEENKPDISERKKYDRENEDYSKIDFLRADDLLNSILLSAPDIKDRKEEIQVFYESHEERAERKEYIMRLFRNGITEYTLDNGETVGHEPYEDALHLWRGKYEDRTEQGYYHWLVITEIFEGMRLFGKLSDRGIMTTADGQLSLMGERAGEDAPAFSFPQEFIDHVLCRRGSGIEHGKFRIYSYFLQGHSRAEKAEFLKKEYGTGGAGPIITGTGISEWHDAKGIEFRKGYGDDAPRLLLSWGTVAKRIDELIRAERYMTKQEIAFLPEYEKGVLSAEIYYFFHDQPDNVIRPYPHRADYSMGMKAVRPQLDMPQRLDTIIQTMAEVLNNTADFARNYPSMQKAYHDLLDYKAGTYSLFTPIPDERGGIEAVPVPEEEKAEAGIDTTEPEKNQDGQEESKITEEKTEQTVSKEESAEIKNEQIENTNAEEETIS
ncbi:MAG: hypothetical protein IJ733_19830, partial [Lachnospiraceae bacterium]|nr:hypothetical protein [Lachnospiraceae bacterium]